MSSLYETPTPQTNESSEETGHTEPSGYIKRRMAQRDVIQALSTSQERANTEKNPELAGAYYDAITVLLDHWKPEASDNLSI